MDIFFQDDDRREYLEQLRQQAIRFGVHFISYCLTTNHVHLIAIPEKPDSLALAVGEAHQRYTRMINFQNNVRGCLLQERFSSCPVNTGDYLFAAIRYVECNPVKGTTVLCPYGIPWFAPWLMSNLQLYIFCLTIFKK